MNRVSDEASEPERRRFADDGAKSQKVAYFILAVLGFSFWFFMAVPFATHREGYWWLATVHGENFSHAFAFLTSTYRPLASAVTWLGFLILDPAVFPTSELRQTLLQVFTWGWFVLAWWLIYSVAPQPRLLALTALVAGAVFFSGYVHLFHIYGIFYVPVMLMLGALLRFNATGTFDKAEVWLAGIAIVLVFWHPFATALFVGFCFGHYVDTFRQRDRAQHVRTALILLAGTAAVFALVVAVPRFWPDASPLLVQTATRSLGTRLYGFLVSYQTNEVNRIASLVAFLLTQMVIFGTPVSRGIKLVALLATSALGALFVLNGLPILLLWIAVALAKLLWLRNWSLFFMMLAAALLPFGGGIGTPIHALFAIIIATYATALGWFQAERALSFVKTGFVIGIAIVATGILLMVRAGVDVPVVTRLASPLLAERERTYQLEAALAWLQHSGYCDHAISFVENAGNPIDSVESVLARQSRPPSALDDVQFYWTSVLQCRKSERPDKSGGIATVTFGGGPALAGSRPVFEIKGHYAGDARVWIGGALN